MGDSSKHSFRCQPRGAGTCVWQGKLALRSRRWRRGSQAYHFTLRTLRVVRSGNPAIRDAAAFAAASEDRRLCVAVFRRVCPYSTGGIVLKAGPIKYRAGPHGVLVIAGKPITANQQ